VKVEVPNDLRPGEAVLVSACLLGEETRYDGGHKKTPALVDALHQAGLRIISVCPEVLGGLPTPRPAASLEKGGASAVWGASARVRTKEPPADVTEEFQNGARAVLEMAKAEGARYAFFQERSPSCGSLQTYVEGALVDGPGVASALLFAEGLQVIAINA